MDYVLTIMETYGYAAMFICMVLENANIPIPSEIILGFAGYLVFQGVFDLNTAIIVGVVAGIVGSILSYWLGEYGGRPVLMKYGKYILFSEDKFGAAEKLFNRYGGAAVFIGRLLPGVRTFISFPAGVAKYPMTPFVIWTTVGTIPWTILLVWLGMKLGEHWKDLIEYNHELLIAMIVVFIVVAVVYGLKYWKRRKQ